MPSRFGHGLRVRHTALEQECAKGIGLKDQIPPEVFEDFLAAPITISGRNRKRTRQKYRLESLHRAPGLFH
jgi:hypothetical protein